MLWWITEQGYRWAMIPTEKSKIDLDKLAREIMASLTAPIQGISTSDKFDQFEGDAYDTLQQLPGQ